MEMGFGNWGTEELVCVMEGGAEGERGCGGWERRGTGVGSNSP